LGSPTTSFSSASRLAFSKASKLALDDWHREAFVLLLAALDGAGDDDAAGLWVMRTAVATLLTFWPPGPEARTKATNVEVALGDLAADVAVIELGHDGHAGEARLAFTLGVEGLGRTRRWTPASTFR